MGDRLKIFIIFLFFFKNVFAVDIGSDSFVERCTVQRVLNNGDRVASFAFLKLK